MLSSSPTRNAVLMLLLTLTLALGAFVLAQPVQADGPTPTPVITDDMVNAIAKQLYCPVCENIPLDVCGTQACAQWRELIREKLQEGWTEEQIKAYFAQQYGERVLATPRPRGFSLLIYVFPPLAILLGVFILYRALQNWRVSPALDITDEDEGEDEAYLRAVEEALKKSE